MTRCVCGQAAIGLERCPRGGGGCAHRNIGHQRQRGGNLPGRGRAACSDMDEQLDATDVPGQERDYEGGVELATEVLGVIAPAFASVADQLAAPAAAR